MSSLAELLKSVPANVVSVGTGTTTLTRDDSRVQILAVTANQTRTVVMPSSGVKAGEVWRIQQRTAVNTVSGETRVVLQSSNASQIDIINAGFIEVVALIDSPVASTDWLVSDYYSALDFNTTFLFNGAGSVATGNRDILLNRTNKIVSLAVGSNVSGTPAGTSTALNAVTAIPTQYRAPTFSFGGLFSIQENGVSISAPVFGRIQQNGIFSIYRDNLSATTAFANSPNTGLSNNIADMQRITYPIGPL